MRPDHLTIAILSVTATVALVYAPQAIFGNVAEDLAVPAVDARNAFTVSVLSYAVAFFFVGPLSDILSARALGTAGALATSLFGGLAAAAPTFSLFLGAVAGAGVSAACVPAAMFASAGRSEDGKAGRFFGVVLAATVAGITVGRGVGGVLTGLIGWRTAYLILAAAALSSGLISVVLPATRTLSGNVLSTYWAALQMLVRPTVFGFLVVGAALFFGYLGITTVLTLRLSSAPFNLDATTIGAVSFCGLIALAGAPLAGVLVPRVGAKTMSIIGLVTCLVGAAVISVASTVWAAAVGLFLLYLGVFAAQPALMVRLAQLVGATQKGAVSSSYFLACLLAGSAGGAALGWAWSSFGWVLASGTATAAVAAAVSVAACLRAADARAPQGVIA